MSFRMLEQTSITVPSARVFLEALNCFSFSAFDIARLHTKGQAYTQSTKYKNIKTPRWDSISKSWFFQLHMRSHTHRTPLNSARRRMTSFLNSSGLWISEASTSLFDSVFRLSSILQRGWMDKIQWLHKGRRLRRHKAFRGGCLFLFNIEIRGQKNALFLFLRIKARYVSSHIVLRCRYTVWFRARCEWKWVSVAHI